MPRYLTWDAQNEMKLFHAILAVHNIKIDYVAVAKMFGSDVPASCIQRHMKYLRHKAATMGIISPKRTSQVRGKGPATGKAGKKSGKAKEETDTEMDDEDEDEAPIFSKTSGDDSSDDGIMQIKPHLTLNQHKTITGRVTKVRTSPRKTAKPDYKALIDQYSADEDNTSEDRQAGLYTKMPSNNAGYRMNTVTEDTKVQAEI